MFSSVTKDVMGEWSVDGVDAHIHTSKHMYIYMYQVCKGWWYYTVRSRSIC